MPVLQFFFFFSQSGFSAHSSNGVFWRTDVFHFQEVQLVSSFINCVCVVSKKSLPKARSLSISLLLSSGSFIVLHFTFRSVIHCELIFVKGVGSVSRFFFFFPSCDIQMLQHHLLKRLSLPHYTLFDFQFRVGCIYVGLILGSLFCPIDLLVSFFAKTTLS